MDLEAFADGIPALAAAVIRSDGVELDVTGAGLDDCFHLGSNTKAMTATLAAVAVERGLLEWTTDVGTNGQTLGRRLAHAAGIRPLPEDGELVGLPAGRTELARLLVAEPP